MKNKIYTYSHAVLFCFGMINSCYSMGLRSFVALPVETEGAVIRLAFERAKEGNTDTLNSSIAYGLTPHQTLLFGLPYRISPIGNNRQGDISALYRHIIWRNDSLLGTERLGLLGGAIVPTEEDRNLAIQVGFVFTQVKNKHEIDIDVLFQSGIDDRADRGRYDLSWQYRLSPSKRPEWGIVQELNSVLELNGRWNEGNDITHQLTVGLQWINQKWVIESGIAKDISNGNELRFIVGLRFHL